MADSKLMSAVGTCDGINYQDRCASLVKYCVLEGEASRDQATPA